MKKVRYLGDVHDVQVRWGGNNDPRGILVPGDEYEVLDIEVHSWHTKIILKEFPNLKFNCVHFEEVDNV